MKNKIIFFGFILLFIFAVGGYSTAAKSNIKTIDGKYPLPTDEGKIAIEQHLWLSNKQSSSSHYAMTNVPKSCQNGVATGFGSFGPLTKKDKNEEKYYITMRWGYADWTEPEADLASGIGSRDTSLTLKSGSDFPKSGFVKIGSEYIRYSARQGNKLKGLRRAYKGAASSQAKGEAVKLVYKYKGGQWQRMTRPLNPDKSEMKWYKEKRVLVTNERNGKRVVASILDSGPAIWTGRAAGLSPEAFKAINADNNEKCKFQFVDSGTDLGKVN